MNNNSRVLQTKGNKITSRFGKRTITYTSGPAKGQTITKNHNGIDIVGTGSTLDYIVAHTAGTVQSAGFDSACGYYVQIKVASGAVMVYYHLAKNTLKVKTGDKVEQGQVLGYMGATGNVTGAHLHFGIKVNGEWINPEPYINADYPAKAATKPVETVSVEDALWFSKEYRKTYTVTASGLNMRTGAGATKKIIKVLRRNEKFTCYGYFNKDKATDSVWLYGMDSTGRVGYCSKRYLQ